jgi:hypothetical protein
VVPVGKKYFLTLFVVVNDHKIRCGYLLSKEGKKERMKWDSGTVSLSFDHHDDEHHDHRVEHNYHDHCTEKESLDFFPAGLGLLTPYHLFPHSPGGRGKEHSFPVKLHYMLEQIDTQGHAAHIVSWQSHGRCFVVHKPEEFVAHILPRYEWTV